MVEPFPGWVDNLNGPYGLWVGALKGVVRFLYGDSNVALSYTPVDWAIRGMIVSAAARASNSSVIRSEHSEGSPTHVIMCTPAM